MTDSKIRWGSAKDALLSMANACADEMQIEFAEALAHSQDTILRYLAAGHWISRAGAYHCEFLPNLGGARKVDKIRNPENDQWVLPREYWQYVQKPGAHESVSWYLSEFDLPLFQSEEGTYSGFAKNVEFDLTYIPEQCWNKDPKQPDRTDDPGRPAKGYSIYKAEFQRRIESGETLPTLSKEAKALSVWFEQTYPLKPAPTAKTIENRIREDFRAAKNATK